MPNHIHGIIFIQNELSVGATPCGCPDDENRGCPNNGSNQGRPLDVNSGRPYPPINQSLDENSERPSDENPGRPRGSPLREILRDRGPLPLKEESPLAARREGPLLMAGWKPALPALLPRLNRGTAWEGKAVRANTRFAPTPCLLA